MTYASKLKDDLFDTTAADAMGSAFDLAWDTLVRSGAKFSSEAERGRVREHIALRIIETAARGERNPLRLHDDALACLGRMDIIDTPLH